jgi:glyoxylase-like metal-dependent hydrolase (beta-lactamase superfamily II)
MKDAFRAAGLKVFERGWLSSNCVLFDGPDASKPVLVDSGYWTHAAQTVALVRHALGERPLRKVVNTHLHSDHCGGNASLVAAFACDVDVPAGEAAHVDRWDAARLSFDATGQHCPRFRRTGSIAAGTEIILGTLPWIVLAAPGHDPHSVALYQAHHQLLISADALWENGFGVVFPEIDGIEAFSAVRQTLDTFAALPIRCVIPGHGSPFSQIDSALERAASRLRSFEQDPERHARHAAKVLVKFHMLEVSRTHRADLVSWMLATPMLQKLQQQFAQAGTAADWSESVIRELVASGTLAAELDLVLDK